MDFGKCQSCDSSLKTPFIKCESCSRLGLKVYVCPTCFSKGQEFSQHKNDHPYSIVRMDFHLFEPSWTAEEEMLLLNALNDHGYGNWGDISTMVPGKSSDQCRSHYEKVYMSSKNPLLRNAEFFSEVSSHCQPNHNFQNTSFGYKNADPSNVFGYNAVREDFDIEFDDQAEFQVCDIEFDDLLHDEENGKSQDPSDVVFSRVNFTIIDIYRRKLQERWRRKAIVREFGLLNKSSFNLAGKYPSVVKSCNGSTEIFRLARLFCFYDFDLLMESLTLQAELKQKVFHLQEFRRNGLRKSHSIQLFEKLGRKREFYLQEILEMNEARKNGLNKHIRCPQSKCANNFLTKL